MQIEQTTFQKRLGDKKVNRVDPFTEEIGEQESK